ncbi:glutathione S-transferase [Rhizoctonia solani AG-3 Rhs1AP]|uniref:Glutathione S-transferase n=1 Tax=Rhizoctonia solani AG-3 Rhs1AP TaxID=1086054 RepID=X8JU06_9AGAM|nr:glutathione S-transferase [Rhizoctonia solani AG-3 Rhs1AP]
MVEQPAHDPMGAKPPSGLISFRSLGCFDPGYAVLDYFVLKPSGDTLRAIELHRAQSPNFLAQLAQTKGKSIESITLRSMEPSISRTWENIIDHFTVLQHLSIWGMPSSVLLQSICGLDLRHFEFRRPWAHAYKDIPQVNELIAFLKACPTLRALGYHSAKPIEAIDKLIADRGLARMWNENYYVDGYMEDPTSHYTGMSSPTVMSPSYVVIGTPFSTFTRTITSALHHKGIPFEQEHTTPHTELARKHHAFGFLPSLVIMEGNDTFSLGESQAIARYIDRVAPSPSLADASQLRLPEKLWELVNIVAGLGFKSVELGVVKPRLQSIDEGKSKESADTCRARLESSGGVQSLRDFFKTLEIFKVGDGPYLMGTNPTWPDFFLYPLVSDLLATPDADVVPQSIVAWSQAMENVKGIKETHKGTLADGARP